MREYYEKIYTEGYESFVNVISETINQDKKMFIITANPETLMIGKKHATFDTILKRKDVCIVPDGIGVVKAGNFLGYPIKERVTGVEISKSLLEILDREKKSIYLFGAKAEVLNKLVDKLGKEYPGIKIAGYHDGYAQDKDKIFEEIVEKKPDVVLVALGIPQQEMLIGKFYDRFEKGIFVGVGGSFDVLSGTKKRAPQIFIKLNIEWLYRILKEPKRIGRFCKSNIRFIFQIIKMKFK